MYQEYAGEESEVKREAENSFVETLSRAWHPWQETEKKNLTNQIVSPEPPFPRA